MSGAGRWPAASVLQMVQGGSNTCLSDSILMHFLCKGEEELFEAFTDYKLSGAENKKLTIRKVSTETEGSYKCRGVNGFGSQVS